MSLFYPKLQIMPLLAGGRMVYVTGIIGVLEWSPGMEPLESGFDNLI